MLQKYRAKSLAAVPTCFRPRFSVLQPFQRRRPIKRRSKTLNFFADISRRTINRVSLFSAIRCELSYSSLPRTMTRRVFRFLRRDALISPSLNAFNPFYYGGPHSKETLRERTLLAFETDFFKKKEERKNQPSYYRFQFF